MMKVKLRIFRPTFHKDTYFQSFIPCEKGLLVEKKVKTNCEVSLRQGKFTPPSAYLSFLAHVKTRNYLRNSLRPVRLRNFSPFEE